MEITLPLWYDLHAHFRQGEAMRDYLQQHLAMGCAGIVAMPNTNPPVSRVFESELIPDEYFSIQSYQHEVNMASDNSFSEIIVPLYLTNQTTGQMIIDGAEAGVLRAVKSYPPHGTTNSGGAVPLLELIDSHVTILEDMEKHGVILCVHGEMHGLSPEAYFDKNRNAEQEFYETVMPLLIRKYPHLKVVCEHVTTKEAVHFVRQAGDNVVATVTPQHLLYTVGYLIQGLKSHLYCMPVVKFSADREALLQAVTEKGQTKFFAGTDSAPHVAENKHTPCGCAAGCFTGGIAPQLYAQAMEEYLLKKYDNQLQSHLTSALKQFLCLNGPNFYRLPIPEETFTLVKEPQSVHVLETAAGNVVPLPVGMNPRHAQEGTTIPWSLKL